ARWRNTRSYVIPQQSIDKPPSAELAPGQLDSDRLPDYEVLDALLEAYIGSDLGRSELVQAGFDEALVDRVVRLVDLAEYKRRQNPPGPKVTSRAFGRDRRLPITSRWRESPAPVPPEIRPEQTTSG
ncbi:MAG: NAD+ synthase, partial [Nocardioidaceae bacterium]